MSTPFLIAWPGTIPGGQVYEHPVSALDFAATAVKVAGALAPDHAAKAAATLEGVNLIPHLKGENTAPPHETLAWRFGPQKAIRRGNWKLVDFRDFEAKTQSGWQLFDLDTDINESKNLAADHPKLVAELSKTWDDWNAKNIPPLWPGTPNEDPKPKK
jgi:uncharacterized sulfatase